MDKERRKKNVKKGLCQVCGARPPKSGRASCYKCLARCSLNARLRRKKHSKRVQKVISKWRKSNPELSRAIYKRHKDKNRQTVFGHYGVTCECCNESIEFLTLDHINKNGGEHRRKNPTRGAGPNFYRWVIKNNFPKDLRPLCWNCNLATHIYGICPHEVRRKGEECQSKEHS